MYQYDHYDQTMVDARVEEFRDAAKRRLEGKLSEDQFKPLRLMNGLYLQLHAYMLRVAIPYGTLDSRKMRQLAMLAETYDKGYGHFTTRQNIQFPCTGSNPPTSSRSRFSVKESAYALTLPKMSRSRVEGSFSGG